MGFVFNKWWLDIIRDILSTVRMASRCLPTCSEWLHLAHVSTVKRHSDVADEATLVLPNEMIARSALLKRWIDRAGVAETNGKIGSTLLLAS